MSNILQQVVKALRPWNPTNAQFQHVAARLKYIPPAEAIESIRCLQRKFDLAFARLEQLGHTRAVDLVNAQVSVAEGICDGKKGPPPGTGFLTKAQFDERLQAERKALKQACRNIGIEAAKIARPLVNEFCYVLETKAKEIDGVRAVVIEDWKFPMLWSDPIAEGLRAVAKAARRHLRDDDAILLCKPTGFTPFIKF